MATECVGKVNKILVKFNWELDNFDISSKNEGDSIKSPNFPADCAGNNTQWHLQLRLKGKNLVLYLCANPKTNARATFKILADNASPAGHRVILLERIIEHVFNTNGYGFYISRELIEEPSSRMSNNDKMIVECEITYVDYEIKYNNKETERDRMENKKLDLLIPRLEDQYENLLNNSNFSDVSLIAEGKAMKVHKGILANSSSVFAAMFNVEMKEKQKNIVKITGIKYDVLFEMIRYIYAGKINNIEKFAGELAVAADKYALNGLKYTCEKTMKKILSLDNVIHYLKIADKLRMDTLKEKAIEFMIENASDISDKPEFDSLPHDILRKVFRCLPKKEK